MMSQTSKERFDAASLTPSFSASEVSSTMPSASTVSRSNAATNMSVSNNSLRSASRAHSLIMADGRLSLDALVSMAKPSVMRERRSKYTFSELPSHIASTVVLGLMHPAFLRSDIH